MLVKATKRVHWLWGSLQNLPRGLRLLRNSMRQQVHGATLRVKTLGIITITVLGLLAVLAVPLRLLLLNNFIVLENDRAATNVRRVLDTLMDDLDALDGAASQYGAWDDTYAFVSDANRTYIEKNWGASTFNDYALNLALILAPDGRLVYGQAFDVETQTPLPLPAQFRQLQGSRLLQHTTSESSVTGFLTSPMGPMLVASRPILTSDRSGPIRGVLILGRTLDQQALQQLVEKTHVQTVSFHSLADAQVEADVEAIGPALLQKADPIVPPTVVQPRSDDLVAGYTSVPNVEGTRELIIRVESDRGIYRQGRASINYAIVALVLAGFLFGLVMLMVLERAVLSRLARLSAEVQRIGISPDPKARVTLSGRDELNQLASTINETLDALEQVHREREKIEAEHINQKHESIALLAGGIAHDFNNILMGIVGNITLAKLEDDANEKTLLLNDAEQATLRAKELTNQLLTFSKGGAPIKKTTSIADLIKDTTVFALRGSTVRCEFDIPAKLWPVDVDKGQISQVINNLVLNAQQAMPHGGTLRVRAYNTPCDRSQAAHMLFDDAGGITIEIEDEGAGIPASNLVNIFDPYFSTKPNGSGLGLATSYSIIRRHGGSIAVHSELDIGTTFRIMLPASQNSIELAEPATPPVPHSSGHVLVMDDEETIRRVLSRGLMRMGYDVAVAQDGAEAIQLYQQATERGQPFDVVVMDLTIPGGMGGQETLSRLRAFDPHVKAIASSGYSHDPVMADYGTYGFCGCVAKPYELSALSSLLHQVIVA